VTSATAATESLSVRLAPEAAVGFIQFFAAAYRCQFVGGDFPCTISALDLLELGILRAVTSAFFADMIA
jgi:hypothetical protein